MITRDDPSDNLGTWELSGLSTDDKYNDIDLSKVPNGSSYTEMQLSGGIKVFLFDKENQRWIEI